MPAHHCHALGCKASCPPRWLMCKPCWSQVPPDLQAEVYRTVKLRGPDIDETWAPWWRAQARAIAHVAFLKSPDVARRDWWLAKEMRTADQLEAMGGCDNPCDPSSTQPPGNHHGHLCPRWRSEAAGEPRLRVGFFSGATPAKR